MKKINNIPVSSRNIVNNKYFKVFVSILLVFMLVMSAILVKVYIDINKEESEKEDTTKDIIDSIDKNIDEYKIFKDEKGLYGLTGKDNKIVIEPCWNEIIILSENRFIVSKVFGKEKKMGIIDNDSNMLIPFIFRTFKPLGNEFIGGFTGENDNFILFDKSGNSLSDKLWTGYKYSDGIIYLSDNKDEYRGKIIDDEFRYIYIIINSVIKNTSFNISVTDQNKIDKIGIENINKISYIINRYFEYMVSDDKESNISDITSEQYLHSLPTNDFFKDCVVKNISDSDITISENDNLVSYNAKIIVNYDYRKKDAEPKNISSEITFNIIKDENNNILLKSINKTEL